MLASLQTVGAENNGGAFADSVRALQHGNRLVIVLGCFLSHNSLVKSYFAKDQSSPARSRTESAEDVRLSMLYSTSTRSTPYSSTRAAVLFL